MLHIQRERLLGIKIEQGRKPFEFVSTVADDKKEKAS